MEKSLVLVLTALLLTACNGGVNPIDSQGFLSGLAGPKVPTVQDALTESAQNAEKNGDFKLASQIYLQILEKKPDNKDIILALADSYRRSGDLDKAMPLYERLIVQDPNMLAAKEGKGLTLIAKGDFDTPAKLFGDIIKADPTRWKTLNALGILFTTRNLNSEAQQYFAEALKHHPDSPPILNNMGLSQALDRRYDTAIVTLRKASDLATAGTLERKRIDLNTALVYASAGKLEEAHTIAANYLSDAALDNNLGLYAHLASDDQMARAYLNMALTESKVFYAKAWDNLQDLSSSSGGKHAHKPATAKKPQPKPEPEPDSN